MLAAFVAAGAVVGIFAMALAAVWASVYFTACRCPKCGSRWTEKWLRCAGKVHCRCRMCGEKWIR